MGARRTPKERQHNTYFSYTSNTETETFNEQTEPWTPDKIEMMTPAEKTTEIKLNLPKIFSGKWTDLNKFIQDVTLYLTINQEVYNNDEKKITFPLLYMTEGDTMSWKEEFLVWKIHEADKADKDLALRSYKKVQDAIKKLFEPFDGPGDALEEMKNLQMANNGNIDKHIAKFKILVTQSGLATSVAVMDLFRETLPTPLQKQVMTCENSPITLEQWYEKATKFHSNWQKMQCIFGQKNNGQKNDSRKKKFFFPIKKEKDPNAMDVDSMSTNECSQLMKKGACFNCKKIRHLSKDCPDKKTGNFSQQKKTSKDTYVQIWAMIAKLPKEDTKNMMDKMEKEPLEMDF